MQHLQFRMDCCRAVKVVFDGAQERFEADNKKEVWAHLLDSIEKYNLVHSKMA